MTLTLPPSFIDLVDIEIEISERMSRVPSGSTVPFTPKPNKKARSSRLTLSDREFNNVGHYFLVYASCQNLHALMIDCWDTCFS
jgi:hypothetical protein